MDKIGLSVNEIDEILEKAIAYGKMADARKHRAVIAEAIEKNNKKLLEDIKKMLAD